MSAWLKNSAGNPDSALTLQVFWTAITAMLVGLFAWKESIDPIVLLGFTGGLAGLQGGLYAIRRGQDNKLIRDGFTTGPGTIPPPDVEPASEGPPGPSTNRR